MKQIPILFSTPMVQAILEGRKTMTRRTMKHQIAPCEHSKYKEAEWKDQPTRWSKLALEKGLAYCELCGNGTRYGNSFEGIKCPYGKPGDALWVREPFLAEACPAPPEGDYDETIHRYKASEKYDPIVKWKPSIFMPKSATRIWLQVTEIRVERLQDISEEDAIAEGVGIKEGESFKYFNPLLPDTYFKDARNAFFSLWESINGRESLDANPWLWCVSFKVLSTTGKPEL